MLPGNTTTPAAPPGQRARACPSCGTPNDEAATGCRSCGSGLAGVPVQEIVDGRYALGAELGRGAMGVVYGARDLGLSREVALKVIAPERGARTEDAVRFRSEAAALARLRSDNVVQIYAFGPYGAGFFFVMEYVHGAALSELVAEHATHRTVIPLARAVSILRSIASGLHAAHEGGVVHRDVKPGNVVVEHRSGRPVLLDFGLALEHGEKAGGAPTGSPAYMSPEQIKPDGSFGPVTPRTDVYALGCTAFELLTGRVPFHADSITELFRSHLEAPRPHASAVRAGLAPFDAVIARAMERYPAARYPTVMAFADALGDALERALAPDITAVTAMPALPTVPLAAPGIENLGLENLAPDARLLEVLIVDDDPVFRRLAARCVQLAWYRHRIRVRTVDSGVAAVAAARETMPALIVLDYRMPGLTGVDTLTRVRDLPQGTDARVIVASASVGDAERWRFRVLGVSDFIEKPIQMPPFVALLGELAAQAGWTASEGAGADTEA